MAINTTTSKTIDDNDVTVIATALAAKGQGGTGGGGNMDRLMTLLEEKLGRERDSELVKRQLESEEKERTRRVKKQNTAALEETKLRLERAQESCSHRTEAPHFDTNLRGWKLISGKEHLVCMYCSRNFLTKEDHEFVDRKGLRPRAELIGLAPTPSDGI